MHVVCSATPALDGMADAEAEITLETYDKHHVKVPKNIATRSAIINMMIEGARLCVSLCIAPRGAAVGEGAGLLQLFQFDRFPPFTRMPVDAVSAQTPGIPTRSCRSQTRAAH